MRIYIFVIILLIFLLFKKYEGYSENNVCRGKLSDIDYLKHMIPHHKVAIDIS